MITSFTCARLCLPLLTFTFLLLTSRPSQAYTKSGATFSTDGSWTDVKAACYAATNPGDTVLVPAGTFTWGDDGVPLYLSTKVKLWGAGTNLTTIQIQAQNAYIFDTGMLELFGPATVGNFRVTFASNNNSTLISSHSAGWRVTQLFYDGTGDASQRFVSVLPGGDCGLIDNCTIIAGGFGTDELIFLQGPDDAWQALDALGSTNAVYVENCQFYADGYVCDANANSSIVVRFCTIHGVMKIDGHGKWSNTPPRSCRLVEAYGNHWTSIGQGGSWDSIELRGGTGILFNNRVDDNTFGGRGIIQLKEYGCFMSGGAFTAFQTPYNYPIDDQIGVGQDPKKGGSAPVYLWNNTKAGTPQILSWAEIPTVSIQLFATETANPAATFTMQDIIKADRDYFNQTNGFDGTSGVGVGTKAQMLSIKAATTKVGFWVTDEGNWNTTAEPNHSGQLYTWNGSAWVLKYVPLPYPFGATSNTYVAPQPGPPLVNAGFALAYKNTPITYSPLTNDAAITPGGYLTIVQVNPTNGLASTDGTNVTFTPAHGFLGTAAFGYTVSDNKGFTNKALDTVMVTNPPAGTPSVENPTLWYKLDGNIIDSSACKNDGTSVGAMIFTNGFDGLANHALYATNGSRVVSPEFNSPPGINWSVSLWFKADKTNGVFLLSCYASGYGANLADKALILNQGVLNGYVWASSGFPFLQSPFKTSTNIWKHVVYGQDSTGNSFLYENGVLAASQVNGPSISQYPTYYFVGGQGYVCGASDFVGAISDVRLYNNYVLTASDVTNIYSAGIQATTTNSTSGGKLTPPFGLRIAPPH